MSTLRILASLVVFLGVSACGGGGGGGNPPPDNTPPNTTITTNPSDPTNLVDAQFTFTSTEAGSTFQCSLDAVAFAACTTPVDYAGLVEGNHTFEVRATDAAGNMDATPASFDWDIDLTPPDTTITDSPADPTNLTDASFQFTSSEAGSTFQCSIDSGALTDCTSPDDYAGLAAGNHSFEVTATDAAGNADPTPATFDWTIDLTAPVVTVPASIIVNTAGPGGVAASHPSIQAFLGAATATDNVDGDLTANITNDALATFPVGMTTVTFSVTDAAGNTGSNTSTVEIRIVDSTAPDTTAIIINGDALYAVSVSELTARLTALDNIGVTAYLITEHNSTDSMNIIPPYLDPLLSASSWVSVTETTALDTTIQYPLAQSYSLGDTVELCAWFRDAAGNISSRVCDSIIYGVDWESGIGFWSADNGVWQVGTPSVVGPAGCFSGSQCAATVLDGNYPIGTDSRLVSASMVLPTVAGTQEIHLRFQQWFTYAFGDNGQLQVSVWDSASSTWGTWISEGTVVNTTSGGWSLKDVDLTAYAGETVRLGFLHTTDSVSTIGAGWYIDDLSIVQITPAFTGTFEAGWDNWGAGNGVWQVGTPSVVGPAGCFNGTQCAATVLDGNYPIGTDSRLVSASMVLPTVVGAENVHLRFQQWFTYAFGDNGQLQVSVWDSVSSTWGVWTSEGTVVNTTSGGWSLKDVDLTAYAGETVRLGFLHTTDSVSTIGAGWYIDDIGISVF